MTKVALRAGIFGLGKAGGSLAASCAANGIVLDAVCSRNRSKRSAFAMQHRGGPKPLATLPAFLRHLRACGTEVLFLAVPDDVIPRVARRLLAAPWLPPIVAHLSGALGADALLKMDARAMPAAFHPLAALDGETSIPAGTLLALDGRARVRRRLSMYAQAMNLEPTWVPSRHRARYHAGAVITANLAVALLAQSMELFRQAGVAPNAARRGLSLLLRSTADAAFARSLSTMLTGPIARGDVGTLARHLDTLQTSPAAAAIYRTLSLDLLQVASLSGEDKAQVRALLDKVPARKETND